MGHTLLLEGFGSIGASLLFNVYVLHIYVLVNFCQLSTI